jgi:hypothetical protein
MTIMSIEVVEKNLILPVAYRNMLTTAKPDNASSSERAASIS